MKVCIDAGHYAKYNRSPVLPSYWESEMTWKLANYLKAELNALGIETVMTRDNQEKDRELVSRGYASKGCDLFISEHSNAANSADPDYAVGIYMRDNPNQTYDDKSREIAKKLAKVTADTMGIKYTTYERKYIGDRDGNGLQDDEYYGVLQGAKLAKTPAMIMENGFHTNLADAKWLSSNNNLKKLAKAQAKAIAEWGGVKGEKPVKDEPKTEQKEVKATGVATNKDAKYNKSYITTANLNLRNAAGIEHKSLAVIPKGTKVRCYGYYSKSKDGAVWLYIQYTLKGIKYTGFANRGWLR